jgi:hypothetical protein
VETPRRSNSVCVSVFDVMRVSFVSALELEKDVVSLRCDALDDELRAKVELVECADEEDSFRVLCEEELRVVEGDVPFLGVCELLWWIACPFGLYWLPLLLDINLSQSIYKRIILGNTYDACFLDDMFT